MCLRKTKVLLLLFVSLSLLEMNVFAAYALKSLFVSLWKYFKTLFLFFQCAFSVHHAHWKIRHLEVFKEQRSLKCMYGSESWYKRLYCNSVCNFSFYKKIKKWMLAWFNWSLSHFWIKFTTFMSIIYYQLFWVKPSW